MTCSRCDPRHECVHFETADELFDALLPVPALETDTVYPTFVFRGQGDATWTLEPKSLRRSRKVRQLTEVLERFSRETTATGDHQVFAEIQLLTMFVKSCDRSVIALPGDSHKFREVWLDDQRRPLADAYKNPGRWPWSEHLALLAFAQHHGILTQLLDWTSDAAVACYFAAKHHLSSDTAELAVWALNTELLHLHTRIELVRMPGANSGRLGAQRGLFTLARQPMHRGAPIDLDHVSLLDALGGKNVTADSQSPLWKLTLPHQEAKRLLYLCHLSGVDGGRVVPDAEGAATAALERAAWLMADPETGYNAETMRRRSSRRIKSQRL